MTEVHARTTSVTPADRSPPVGVSLIVVGVTLLLTPAALGAQGDDARRATMQDLRHLGSGLMAWLTDQAAQQRPA
jgi:hypothetical protein